MTDVFYTIERLIQVILHSTLVLHYKATTLIIELSSLVWKLRFPYFQDFAGKIRYGYKFRSNLKIIISILVYYEP